MLFARCQDLAIALFQAIEISNQPASNYIMVDQLVCILVSVSAGLREDTWEVPVAAMDFSQSAEELLTKLDTYREQLAQVEEAGNDI